MSLIILDVEIEKAIPSRNEPPIEGIQYCEGWRDFEGMGVACVCTYEIPTGLSRVFLKDQMEELQEFLRGKATGGFNTRRFDMQLLGVHDIHLSPEAPHYDILEQIWVAQGLDPDNFNPRTHGGWGLDAVSDSTLGAMKSGNGALAPVWWQQGLRGRVVDYCLRDVWLEAKLLQYIVAWGRVVRGFNVLPVRVPEDVIEACRA